jgi:hypothetical protein
VHHHHHQHRHAKPARKSPSAHTLKAVRMACTSSQACFQEKLQLFKKKKHCTLTDSEICQHAPKGKSPLTWCLPLVGSCTSLHSSPSQEQFFLVDTSLPSFLAKQKLVLSRELHLSSLPFSSSTSRARLTQPLPVKNVRQWQRSSFSQHAPS